MDKSIPKVIVLSFQFQVSNYFTNVLIKTSWWNKWELSNPDWIDYWNPKMKILYGYMWKRLKNYLKIILLSSLLVQNYGTNQLTYLIWSRFSFNLIFRLLTPNCLRVHVCTYLQNIVIYPLFGRNSLNSNFLEIHFHLLILTIK